MIWYIIRHADKESGSFYNEVLRHQDPPISSKGRLEAQKLLPYFLEQHISAIYVSSYQRTRQTIQDIASQLQLTPRIDDRLNEIDNGIIEGLPDADLKQKFPDIWKAYTGRQTDFRFPEGETGEEARQRILKFFQEKLRVHSAEDIIIVSHDGLIRLLMCSLMDLPVYKRWNFQVDTCGIMEVTYQPDFNSWKLVRFNQKCP